MFTEDDARVIALMNYRGEIMNTHVIKDFENNDVYLISIKSDNSNKLIMIENTGKATLIEENII